MWNSDTRRPQGITLSRARRRTTTPTASVVSTGKVVPGTTLLCRWGPVKAWHPHMSTNDRTDAVYGVTDDERLRLLLEEQLEETRRLADAVERLNERLATDEEATAR